jgi:hypothetical protein
MPGPPWVQIILFPICGFLLWVSRVQVLRVLIMLPKRGEENGRIRRVDQNIT